MPLFFTEMKKLPFNIYEVNVRQYTAEGTLVAFAQHLPRLAEMGVACLWFMPLTPISALHRKGTLGSPYAAADFLSLNPEFGTVQDFQAVVKAAHQLGMKVIIDWVANHTGWDHSWAQQHPEFYKKEPNGTFKIASGMADIIELDYENPAMRAAMIAAMNGWLENFKIDGFRCDLASWVPLDFWKEVKKALDPQDSLFFLGEYDDLENPEYGEVFDASYPWQFMHQSERFVKEKSSLISLQNLLQDYQSLNLKSRRAWFTTNHDENSWNGTEYEKYGALAGAFAVFSYTFPGLPLVYSGQEKPVHHRLEFFEKDDIAFQNRYDLFGFYKRLNRLRAQYPEIFLAKNNLEFLETDAPDSVLAYQRTGRNAATILLNLSEKPVDFQVKTPLPAGQSMEIFTGGFRDLGQNNDFTLKPGEYRVYLS